MTKNETTKTIVGIIAAALIVLAWGIAFGGIKEKVNNNSSAALAVKAIVENNKETIFLIKEDQAYQKGVVNTKLDNLKTGQQQIMNDIEKLVRSK